MKEVKLRVSLGASLRKQYNQIEFVEHIELRQISSSFQRNHNIIYEYTISLILNCTFFLCSIFARPPLSIFLSIK